MKQIIHITDSHSGYGKLQYRFELLIDQIIATYAVPQDIVVVLTGDIIDDATKDEDYSSVVKPIEKLRTAGFHLLCCPGNHDYGAGGKGDKKYVQAFKRVFWGDENIHYPVKTIVDAHSAQQSIAFIGLDSMAEELAWDDNTGFKGEVGAAQLLRLTQMLGDDDVIKAGYLVVYLHHHPFGADGKYTLKDAAQLGKVLKNSLTQVDMLLFGHKHDGLSWHGQWGIPRVYDGGTATFKDNNPGPFRVIDLSRDDASGDHQDTFLENYRQKLIQHNLLKK